MRFPSTALRVLTIVLPVLAMTACATHDNLPPAPHTIGDGTVVESRPKGGWGKDREEEAVTPNPHRKIGNPYKVAGIWYYPEEDPAYNRTGIASWYGPKFHGLKTANGEIFDMNQLSAAHPTLPMPSYVRVTNLENGRVLELRLNDRGPFAHNRVIDLSRAAAERLGFKEEGLAEVRVEYLRPASLDDAIVALKPVEDMTGSPMMMARYDGEEDTVRTRIATGPEIAADGHQRQPEEWAAAENDVAAGAEQRFTASSVLGQQPASIAHAATPVTFPDMGEPVNPNDLNPISDAPRGSAPAPTTTVEMRHLVQIGAYSSSENADRAAEKFDDAVPVRTMRLERASGGWLYRVRLGPFLNRDEAETALTLARTKGFEDATIVTAQ